MQKNKTQNLLEEMGDLMNPENNDKRTRLKGRDRKKNQGKRNNKERGSQGDRKDKGSSKGFLEREI